MFLRTNASRAVSQLSDFVDSGFLDNERPKIPGGSWTIESLKIKSTEDLQKIWYTIIKEKNKLNTMQRHYTQHQEKLGAMPAPSRVNLLMKSLENIGKVLRERHDIATQRAQEMFEKRRKQGMYRYPPGPHEPPQQHTSVLVVTLEAKPFVDSVKEIFADKSVFEQHKGIVKIDICLPPDVLKQKEKAHEAFEEWFHAKRAFEDYRKYNDFDSACDNLAIEIAPGEFSTGERARDIPVPSPMSSREPPVDVLKRLEWEGLLPLERSVIQLGYFPNITSVPPEPPGERPTHPDEIKGPWEISIEFDTANRADIVCNQSQITDIDGHRVLSMKVKPADLDHSYVSLPNYEIADQREKAYKQWKENSPLLTEWKDDYKRPFARPLIDIISYNYNNKIDYAEREARMMGQNLWEPPVPIDYTCGKSYQVPRWISERDQWDADVPRFPMELESY